MGQIWAIARNLMVEVARMRALMIFLALLLAGCTLGFALWLHGGAGPIDQKVQTFLSYSLSFVFHILALLTIFISIATITRDIKRQEIHTITTKPISRGRFLVGKFLGLVLLNLILLSVSGAAIYTLARILPHAKSYGNDELARLNELVFNARRGVTPPLPDIAQQVRQEVEQEVEQKIQEEHMTEPAQIAAMRQVLTSDKTNQIMQRYRSVEPGSHIIWHFTGIKSLDREKGNIYLRYKQEVSPTPLDLATTGQWFYGPTEDVLYSGASRITRDVVRTVHEFPIPARTASSEGDLYVAYRNLPLNYPVVIIYPSESRYDNSIELLYKAGNFNGNFLRTLGACYLRLVFLSLLGLALGAWLSFPVAVLGLLVVFVIGLSSNFIAEAVEWDAGKNAFSFAKIIMPAFPKFAAYDPVPQIEKGRLVPYQMLRDCFFFLVLIKGGLAGLFGYLIFKFRELARVIV